MLYLQEKSREENFNKEMNDFAFIRSEVIKKFTKDYQMLPGCCEYQNTTSWMNWQTKTSPLTLSHKNIVFLLKPKDGFKIVVVRNHLSQIIYYDPLKVNHKESLDVDIYVSYVKEFLNQDHFSKTNSTLK